MLSLRKHNLLTLAAAGGKQRAACLARSHSSSPSIHPQSISITTSRISSPREGFVMTRRKKESTSQISFCGRQPSPPRGKGHEEEGIPQVLPYKHSSLGWSQLSSTLSYIREVKKASSSSRQEQCFLQPFLSFPTVETGYLQAKCCVGNSTSRLF